MKDSPGGVAYTVWVTEVRVQCRVGHSRFKGLKPPGLLDG